MEPNTQPGNKESDVSNNKNTLIKFSVAMVLLLATLIGIWLGRFYIAYTLGPEQNSLVTEEGGGADPSSLLEAAVMSAQKNYPDDNLRELLPKFQASPLMTDDISVLAIGDINGDGGIDALVQDQSCVTGECYEYLLFLADPNDYGLPIRVGIWHANTVSIEEAIVVDGVVKVTMNGKVNDYAYSNEGGFVEIGS